MVLYQGMNYLYILTIGSMETLEENHHKLSRDELNIVLSLNFIKNYVEIHTILLPGQIPGLKDYEKSKTAAMQHIKKAALLGICGVL